MAACIDEEVADLVLACWERGIRTTESCQGDGEEPTFLSFERVEDLVRFATLVIEGGPRDEVFLAAVETWGWDFIPLDASWVEREMPDAEVPPVAGFLPCVNIPHSDIDGATSRLRARPAMP